MVHRLVVSYGTPTDTAAFDTYYRDTHADRAPAAGPPRLSFEACAVAGPAQQAPYLVAELDFESEAAMRESLGSPEGRAAGKDLGNFATGGVTLVHFDVHDAT